MNSGYTDTRITIAYPNSEADQVDFSKFSEMKLDRPFACQESGGRREPTGSYLGAIPHCNSGCHGQPKLLPEGGANGGKISSL